jgi:hypothetical protein
MQLTFHVNIAVSFCHRCLCVALGCRHLCGHGVVWQQIFGRHRKSYLVDFASALGTSVHGLWWATCAWQAQTHWASLQSCAPYGVVLAHVDDAITAPAAHVTRVFLQTLKHLELFGALSVAPHSGVEIHSATGAEKLNRASKSVGDGVSLTIPLLP